LAAADFARDSEHAAARRLPFFRDEFAPGLRIFDLVMLKTILSARAERERNMESLSGFVKRGNKFYISDAM
jgi:hypothetical protein